MRISPFDVVTISRTGTAEVGVRWFVSYLDRVDAGPFVELADALESVRAAHEAAVECEQCGTLVRYACGDMVCRDCHVSLSFEECVSDEYVNRLRASAGLPPRS